MKMVFNETNDILKIQKISEDLQGVFKLSDLQILLKSENLATMHNRIGALERIGILKRFCRGIYITRDFSKDMLSSTINPLAYISMGTILAKNGLIGTIPINRLFAVRVGRNRNYKSSEFTISHFGIAQ